MAHQPLRARSIELVMRYRQVWHTLAGTCPCVGHATPRRTTSRVSP